MTHSAELEALIKQFSKELWVELEAQRPLSPAIRYHWQGAMQVLSEVYGQEQVQACLALLWREQFGQLDAVLAEQLERFEMPAQAATAPVYPSSNAGKD